MYIFVTVGTFSNDALISKIEEISQNSTNHFTLQTGNYSSRHHRSFQFKDSIKQELREADLIITSGGSGTILEALEMKKNIIVVVNNTLQDNHQEDLVARLERDGYLRRAEINTLEEKIQENYTPKLWSSNRDQGSIEICKIIHDWINI